MLLRSATRGQATHPGHIHCGLLAEAIPRLAIINATVRCLMQAAHIEVEEAHQEQHP